MLKRLLVASCTTLLLAGSGVAGIAEDAHGEELRPQAQGNDSTGDSTLGTGDLGTSGSGATGDELPERNAAAPEASAREVAPYPYD